MALVVLQQNLSLRVFMLLCYIAAVTVTFTASTINISWTNKSRTEQGFDLSLQQSHAPHT
jgi:hypothetical protein